jgi:hypothetical protein
MGGDVYLPVRLFVDGREVESDTRAFAIGARGLALITCAAEVEALLYSLYVGHDELAEALVSELIDVGGSGPKLRSRRVRVGEGALTYGRRFALDDHLGSFAKLLAERGGCDPSFRDVELAAPLIDPAAV